MTDFTCEKCGLPSDSVRLVEHGTDDVALCKRCFKSIAQGAGSRKQELKNLFAEVFDS